MVKGETELPTAGMLDWRRSDQGGKGRDDDQDGEERGVCGIEKENVPFLVWGKESEMVVGGGKRKVRRNVGRRG